MFDLPEQDFDVHTLHVGDKVVIDLTSIYGYKKDDHRSQPFEVELTKVIDRGYAMDGKKSDPAVCWKPTHETVFVDSDGDASCSAAYVAKIVQRAPYRCERKLVNHVRQQSKRHNVLLIKPWSNYDMVWKRFGNNLVVPPYYLVLAIVENTPGLHMPYGISAERFMKAWEQAGRPGHVGYYHLRSETLYHGQVPPTSGEAIPLSEISDWVINRRKFRAWVLKNLDKIGRTASQYRSDSIRAARDEDEAMAEAMMEDLSDSYL